MRNAVLFLIVSAMPSIAIADEPAAATGSATKATPPPAAEKAANFTLPNAQDGMTRVKWPREKAVFLTFGEQASQVPTQAWTARMKENFGGRMEFVGVAWLQSVPSEMHPAAAAVIKATHPEVLMDKSGSCAQRYQCRKGDVNAFVIAPDGTILMRIHEAMTDERFAEVEKLLEPYTKTE